MIGDEQKIKESQLKWDKAIIWNITVKTFRWLNSWKGQYQSLSFNRGEKCRREVILSC